MDHVLLRSKRQCAGIQGRLHLSPACWQARAIQSCKHRHYCANNGDPHACAVQALTTPENLFAKYRVD